VSLGRGRRQERRGTPYSVRRGVREGWRGRGRVL